jgi:hypothetical protein
MASELLNQSGMTAHLVVGVMLTWLTATNGTPSRQASPPSTQTTTPDQPEKPLVVVGCVASDQARSDQFTLADEKAGTTYRLNGTKLATYNGRRVRIVGGLYPSDNVAAQAGAIDPSKAAIAASTAAETRAPQLPEFHVKEVRPLRGSCSPSLPK